MFIAASILADFHSLSSCFLKQGCFPPQNILMTDFNFCLVIKIPIWSPNELSYKVFPSKYLIAYHLKNTGFISFIQSHLSWRVKSSPSFPTAVLSLVWIFGSSTLSEYTMLYFQSSLPCCREDQGRYASPCPCIGQWGFERLQILPVEIIFSLLLSSSCRPAHRSCTGSPASGKAPHGDGSPPCLFPIHSNVGISFSSKNTRWHRPVSVSHY